MMQLHLAAEAMSGVLHGQDAAFSAVQTDSRALNPGALFFALRGDNFDGHDFLFAAQERGAVGAVVQFYDTRIALPQIVVSDTTLALGLLAKHWRQQFKGVVVALTGSSGKTTVKGFLNSVLSAQGSTHATHGNLNNHIGVPLTLFGLAEQQYAVVEIGTNHPGEIAYLTDIVRPDIALVNNIGPAHMEGFGSLAAIAQEKSAIYSQLKTDQTAVINLDDAFAQTMIAQTGSSHQIGFGTNQSATITLAAKAAGVQLNELGCAQFNLHLAGEQQPVQLKVMGAHNVQNALAASACAHAAGVPLQTIVQGLENFSGEKGRMQLKHALLGAKVIDDTYNANPGSVKAAIDLLQQCTAPRILVFGNMGELGDICDQAHQEIGAYAKAHAVDILFSVGDKAALAAVSFGEQGRAFTSQEELMPALQKIISPEATILIKGSRSAHMEYVVNALCNKEQALC